MRSVNDVGLMHVNKNKYDVKQKSANFFKDLHFSQRSCGGKIGRKKTFTEQQSWTKTPFINTVVTSVPKGRSVSCDTSSPESV